MIERSYNRTADELRPTAAPAVLREAEPELGAMFGLVD